MELNRVMSKEEQIELTSDCSCEFIFENRHEPKVGYLPMYIREAMKKAGVIRTEDGKFVKVAK